MSCKNAGAIIRIIFYILRLDGKINEYFNASYISDRYDKLLKHPAHKKRIKNFIEKFKKHGSKKGISTLDERNKLLSWLSKHTKPKRIFWFDRSNGSFKLKKKYIKCLNDLMKD